MDVDESASLEEKSLLPISENEPSKLAFDHLHFRRRQPREKMLSVATYWVRIFVVLCCAYVVFARSDGWRASQTVVGEGEKPQQDVVSLPTVWDWRCTYSSF
jgi:hypothetical protein